MRRWLRGAGCERLEEVDQMRRIPVYVVLPSQTMLLDVAGPLEVLRVANRDQEAVRFDVRYVGPTRFVLTSIGVTVAGVEALPRVLPEGSMVVLSGDGEYGMM